MRAYTAYGMPLVASASRISDRHTMLLRRCLMLFANPVPLTQRAYEKTAPKLCKGQLASLRLLPRRHGIKIQREGFSWFHARGRVALRPPCPCMQHQITCTCRAAAASANQLGNL
jgi:hypothetical protein